MNKKSNFKYVILILSLGWNTEDQGGKERPSRTDRPSVKGFFHRRQWNLRNLGVGRKEGQSDGKNGSHEECSRFHQKERHATN